MCAGHPAVRCRAWPGSCAESCRSAFSGHYGQPKNYILVIRQVDTPCDASFLSEKCSQSDETQLRSFLATATIGHRGRVAGRPTRGLSCTVSHRARIATAALCAAVLGELRVGSASQRRPRPRRSRAKTRSTPPSGMSPSARRSVDAHPGGPGSRQRPTGVSWPFQAEQASEAVQRRVARLADGEGRGEGCDRARRRGDGQRQVGPRRPGRLCRGARHHGARR